jgi:hypothetical protein
MHGNSASIPATHALTSRPSALHLAAALTFPHPPTMECPLDLESLAVEERIQHSLKAIEVAGRHPDGRLKLSIRKAAETFRVPRSTLTNRFNGVRTRKEAHAHQQNLAPAQEEVLVEWIKVMGRRGVPFTQRALQDFAEDICRRPIGDSWPKRFLARHPELKVKWTTSLESCRAQALNPTVVGEYFSLLRETMEEYQIKPENIYNMDEKGVQLSIGSRVAALVDRDQKSAYQLEDGNRELITIIETICADGTALQPSVIFQGAQRNLEWGRTNPCNAR